MPAPARSVLQHVLLNDEGEPLPSTALAVTKVNGDPLDESMYTTLDGIVTVVTPQSNGVGLVEAYKASPGRVRVTPTGGTAVDTAFWPDPGDLAFKSCVSTLDPYYGIVADGVTDVTARLQALITDAETDNALVFWEPGSHLVTGITATKRLIWRGSGMWRSTLLLKSSVSTTTDNLTLTAGTGIEGNGGEISDLGIVAQSAAAGRHAIHLNAVDETTGLFRLKISRCVIMHSASVAASRAINLTADATPVASPLAQLTLDDNEIYGGVKLIDAHDSVWITRNHFYGANVGLEASTNSGAAKWVIRENTFVSDGGGVWLKADMISPTIRDNYFERGTAFSGSPNSALLDLDGAAADDIDSALIDGNQFSLLNGITGSCIRLDHTSRTRIDNNTFDITHANAIGILIVQGTNAGFHIGGGNVKRSGAGAMVVHAVAAGATAVIGAIANQLGGFEFKDSAGGVALAVLTASNGIVELAHATTHTGTWTVSDSGTYWAIYSDGTNYVVKNKSGVTGIIHWSRSGSG